MGDGRAEGTSAIGDRGQAAISLTSDVDGTHVHIFESSQLEGSYVRDLLYLYVYVMHFPCSSLNLSLDLDLSLCFITRVTKFTLTVETTQCNGGNLDSGGRLP